MVFTGRAVPDVFPEARSRDHAHPEKRQGGAPTGNRVPVRLFRLRRRPPAHEQRGLRLPGNRPHDHAARATLGRRDAIGVPEGRGSQNRSRERASEPGVLIALPASAPSNDVWARSASRSARRLFQNRFETASPFEARPARPRKNAGRVPGILSHRPPQVRGSECPDRRERSERRRNSRSELPSYRLRPPPPRERAAPPDDPPRLYC